MLVRIDVLVLERRDEVVVGVERNRRDLPSVCVCRRCTYRVHLGRDGGREEQGLPGRGLAVGQALENLDELAAEALVEQSVGLVEDKSGCRELLV